MITRDWYYESGPPPAHILDSLDHLTERLRAPQRSDDGCQGAEVVQHVRPRAKGQHA